MKLVTLTCPTCGAQLDVDMTTGQARCRFCKEVFQISDGAQDAAMNDAEQMGYDFERGRQRASVEFTQGFADRMAEARQHMPAMDPEPVYEPTFYVPAPAPAPVAPARSEIPVWVLVLLWIFVPPVGMFATVFTLVKRARNSNGAAAMSVGTILFIFWLLFVLISIAF